MIRLVQLYQAHRCLWDTTNAEYSNRLLREAAIVDIAAALGSRRGQISRAQIMRKLHVLRTTYRYEKRRIKQRMRTGQGAKTKLKWFPLADAFLRTAMKSSTNDECDSDLDENTVVSLDQSVLLPLEDEEEELQFKQAEAARQQQQDVRSELPINDADPLCVPDILQEPTSQESLIKDSSESRRASLIKSTSEYSDDNLISSKWPLSQSIKFLRLYAAHPCLWHLQHADNRSAPARRAALIDIAAAMGSGLTVAYVEKKIKILRITYMQHRKRMLAERLAGKEPELQLRWYPLADCFLRPHIGRRSIEPAALAQETPQYDADYVYANLNLIDPSLLSTLHGVGTQNQIDIGEHVE